jgi:Tir chaperone protein (CesT) family
MAEISPWRSRFLDFVQQLRSERMLPAATLEDDPEQTMKLTLYVDGVRFEVLHHPEEGRDSNLVVRSCFGLLPNTHHRILALRQALQNNYILAMSYAGVFTLEPATDEIIWITLEPLDSVEAAPLLQALQMVANHVQDWQLTYNGADGAVEDGAALGDRA